MKRISFLVALAMLLSLFSTVIYAEDNSPIICASTTKSENNTVELLLSISEGSNVAGGSFNIVYDSNKLTYVSHEIGSIILPMINFVNPHYNANAIRVLWVDTNELTVGGEIIKVIFTINDGATGSTDIVIDKLKMLDTSSLPVDCSCENSTIIISESIKEDDDVVDSDKVEDSFPQEGTDDSSSNSGNGNASSNNSSLGGNSLVIKPSTGTTQSNKGESSKEPVYNGTDTENNENIEDTAPPSPIDPTETEDDFEVFLLMFDDVDEAAWYFESVRFVKYHHLMNGISENKFDPNSSLTRGMLVTILYRLSGEPECNEPTFDDVEKNMWYSNGIAWAEENKIVNGVGENKFAPNSNITREQIALILYNYSKLYNLDTTESANIDMFKDYGEVSEWAKKATVWSVGAGILSGKDDNILDPKGNATRAEIATVLMRYAKKYNPS